MSPAPTRLPDGDPDGTRSLGTSLMLVASAMMFGALLLLHFLLRRDGAGWPGGPPLPRGVATLATGILLASSLTMEFATRSVRGARLDRLPTWVGSTLAMGVIFVALVLWLWFEWTSGGHGASGPRSRLFYVITAVHGAHLLTALGLLIWLLRGARKQRFHGRSAVAVRLVGRFWHFLGAAWLLIYLRLFWS